MPTKARCINDNDSNIWWPKCAKYELCNEFVDNYSNLSKVILWTFTTSKWNWNKIDNKKLKLWFFIIISNSFAERRHPTFICKWWCKSTFKCFNCFSRHFFARSLIPHTISILFRSTPVSLCDCLWEKWRKYYLHNMHNLLYTFEVKEILFPCPQYKRRMEILV